mmetsp:Transcript_16437/g.27877  ORF Transcript_16437/g.27877 Transcript_16437/m.27877 type:complete len:153 (+) Transcript_16437:2420-2878(+)
MSKEDLHFKQKSQNLERNLEQIHQMYQSVTSEKSVLKVDIQVLERKLCRKDEKISQLENSYMHSRQKQQDYLVIIRQLKDEFIKVQNQQAQVAQLSHYHGQGNYNTEKNLANKIVGGVPQLGPLAPGNYKERKTIRGGGGGNKRLTTPRIIQ